MLSSFKKTNSLIGQTPLRSMASRHVMMKDLALKTKFHNNRNVPWLFKNSATDDYVRTEVLGLQFLDPATHGQQRPGEAGHA